MDLCADSKQSLAMSTGEGRGACFRLWKVAASFHVPPSLLRWAGTFLVAAAGSLSREER